MLIISEILKKSQIGIEYDIQSEEPIESLGLVNYSQNGKSQCTFIDDIRFLKKIRINSKMVITTSEIAENLKDRGLCITDKPRVLFFSIHNELSNNKNYCRGSVKSTVGVGCKISNRAYIAEENVQIGKNVVIEEFASIKENTVIGDNSIIRAGVIIGGEGFEFKRDDDVMLPVKHLGGVIIGRNVEIQYNTCIDKAVYPWDDTVIGDFSKIDKLIYIAHGVKVGSNVLIVGQSGILGRTIIEDNAKIGMGTALRNAIHIGSNADVSIGAVVTQDVSNDTKVSGNFAIDHNKYLDFIKTIK